MDQLHLDLVWCPNDGFTGTHGHIVIPAKAGIQTAKPGFRIKSGMTDTVKLLLRHYTRGPEILSNGSPLGGQDYCLRRTRAS
jgi:hypothetical protein